METIKILIPFITDPVEVILWFNGGVHKFIANSNLQLWKELHVLLKREVIRAEGIHFRVVRPDDFK